MASVIAVGRISCKTTRNTGFRGLPGRLGPARPPPMMCTIRKKTWPGHGRRVSAFSVKAHLRQPRLS